MQQNPESFFAFFEKFQSKQNIAKQTVILFQSTASLPEADAKLRIIFLNTMENEQ